ncbi:hypothetical protein Hanom_Chr10g00943291 [Helianthus anomalus]
MSGLARPRGQFLFSCFCLGRCCRMVRHFTLFLLLVIKLVFGSLFVPFVILSPFGPVNSKGRKKHAFSNISTKKGWFYVSIDGIYMLHFVHISHLCI